MKPGETESRYRDYWRRCLRITVVLLIAWAIVTFGVSYFARELNSLTFLGFPLGFYMSGQGSLLIYALIVGVYARYMDNLDRRCGITDENE